jgi:hypothetical protein
MDPTVFFFPQFCAIKSLAFSPFNIRKISNIYIMKKIPNIFLEKVTKFVGKKH